MLQARLLASGDFSFDSVSFNEEERDVFPSPSAGPSVDEVMHVLDRANHWQFDTFKLQEVRTLCRLQSCRCCDLLLLLLPNYELPQYVV